MEADAGGTIDRPERPPQVRETSSRNHFKDTRRVALASRVLHRGGDFMRRLLLLSLALSGVALARPAWAVDQCALLDMTVTAAPSVDPGFEGLYKYTVTGSWDVTQNGISHIDFFLQLKDLECICDPRVVKFPTPGGTSNGTSPAGPCVLTYTGKYNCMGDPTVPAELTAPTIKFNTDDGICVGATTGTGTWVFYSPFAPGPYTVDPEGAAIKHGQGICVGTLKGTMPMGDCATAAAAKSWGGVKAMYR
jgi:hypothetical protein